MNDIQRAINALRLEGGLGITGNLKRVNEFIQGLDAAISAMKEIQQYRQIGTPEQIQKFDALYLEKCQEVNALRERMRWIPVTERLPENKTRVLVTFEDGFVAATEYYDNGWDLWADSGDVVAWMPLPEPYREEV